MSCIVCGKPAQGYVIGTLYYPPHDCKVCADHCTWARFYPMSIARGRPPRGPRRWTATWQRARSTRC